MTRDEKIKEIKTKIKALIKKDVTPENRLAYNEELQTEYTKLMKVISEAA